MIEHLESRIAPAALVITASDSKISISGADADTGIVVNLLADISGGVKIFLNPGDTAVLNKSVVTGTEIDLSSFAGDIVVTGGAGNDVVNLFGDTVAGKVTLSLGEGNNTTNIGVRTIGGALTVMGGAGGDFVNWSGNQISSPVVTGGAMKFSLGEGANGVMLAGPGVSIGGGLTYLAGSGQDQLQILGNGSAVSVHGNITYSAGDGNSLFTMNGSFVSVGGALKILEGNNTGGIDAGIVNISANPVLTLGRGVSWTTGTGSHEFGLNAQGALLAVGQVKLALGGTGDVSLLTGQSVVGGLKVSGPDGGTFSYFAVGESNITGGAKIFGFSTVQFGFGGGISGGLVVSDYETAMIAKTGQRFTIGGSVKLSPTEAGNNVTTLGGLSVRGALSYAGSTGVDNVGMTDMNLLGSARILLGEGADSFSFLKSTPIDRVMVSGAFTLDLGVDTSVDQVVINSDEALGQATFLGSARISHSTTEVDEVLVSPLTFFKKTLKIA